MQDSIYNILEEITGEDLREESNENLFDTGRLDSLGIIELIVAIEDTFNIKLDPAIVGRKDIETPNKLIEYLQNMQDHKNLYNSKIE
ncbi:D-alanine--poly(phosphoribitol) ligase subunit DltC [Clostridium frigoris]|uniref:D-alanyl carrier protein n=1 Tax=Clostridium frigoris TaxID=205327 RepID=A0ABS6BUW3_9CLOT|nr:D-alanine--poly(phosphoribitol) ligase subunit DltC [Clostridium frigoris]MBU3160706.1 D-alanine--poly(phosphoribitol) ligase subunit DltC [Clostridium frigoris]